MITNLLATLIVCVVTNVTTTTDEVLPQNPWNIIYTEGYVTSTPCNAMWTWPTTTQHPATTKTETTEVVEVRTLKFTWEGEEHTATHNTVLSRKVRVWKRKENWVEE